MSLYIGNLSPRVGKDELEHVFGRFGRCNIRLKDGYGFAIYGIRAQAEVALRALRGRNMCGLPISLSWSNKQPNAPQSFNRGGRPYETPQPGRGFGRRDDHMNGPLRSNARQQYKFKQPDGDTERLQSDLPVEKESSDRVSEDQEATIKKEDGQDKSDNVDHNTLDSGRWGEFGRLSHDSHIEDGTTFDRYEPDREHDKLLHDPSTGKEVSEYKSKSDEAVDVASRSQNTPRKNQACFKCGDLGHKMRDCMQDASRMRKLSSTSAKEGVRGRKDSGSGKYQRVKRRRSSPVSSEYSDHGKAHGRRKQSEDENENFRYRRHGKRIRRSLSRSRSQSSSASSSCSYSTSRSSLSTRLISKRNRLNARLETSRSRSPAPLLLSISPVQPLPSPLNKSGVNSNGYLDSSTSLKTKPDVIKENQNLGVVAQEDNICIKLVQENQQLDIALKEENYASGDTMVVVQEENLGLCADVKDDLPMKSDLEITYTTRANYKTISLDELDRVMKHYNMKHTEENGGHLSIEDYFGGARLWPWEIIYYRRLKKGPISTENYARRLAQNKEFGVTDKYVRSSSGWGEPIQEL